MSKQLLEVEVMFLAKVANFDFLQNTHVVKQEQYDLLSFGEDKDEHLGSLRVRREIEGRTVKYWLVSKVNQANGVKDENTSETTEAMFEAFRAIRQGFGLRKNRHYFPVTDTSSLPAELRDAKLVWEVDVFPRADGSYDPWIKIDLELPAHTPEQLEALKQIKNLPPLPVPVLQIVSGADDRDSAKQLRDQAFDRWNGLLRQEYLAEHPKSKDDDEPALESLRNLSTSFIYR